MARVDVVIIGAGAMGAATAWHLARRGASVVILEQFTPAHEHGSSHGTSRIFRLTHSAVEYIRLAQAAGVLWRELEEEAGVALLTVTGGVDHGSRKSLVAIEEALSVCDVPFERLHAQEAMERWSGMRFDGPVVFQPDAGRLNAELTVVTLLEQAARFGADLHINERVSDIRLDTNRGRATVHTSLGVYDTRMVVATCGAWLPKMLKRHVPLPAMRVTQEQPAFFIPRDPAIEWPCFVHRFATAGMSDENGGAYGLFTPGEGLKVGERGTGSVIDPDEPRPPANAERLDRLARYVAEWLPGVDLAPTAPTTCLYTMTPTEDFIIDRRGPLVIGSACSGHGFKFTPEIGRLLADLALGCTDVTPRFALPTRS